MFTVKKFKQALKSLEENAKFKSAEDICRVHNIKDIKQYCEWAPSGSVTLICSKCFKRC